MGRGRPEDGHPTRPKAAGQTGIPFKQAEVARARRHALRFPGALTVPEARQQLAAARARGDAEADRLGAILAALLTAAIPTPAEPAPPG